METLAVHIQELSHHYGQRLALNNVSLAVRRGELFGLLGPNGGGKTTLFRILSTLVTPQTGRVELLGHDLVTARQAVREQIGVVFQAPSLDKQLTVRENLRHQGHLYRLQGAELNRRMAAGLERFGLTERAGEKVKTLSGGLQRRVELAKALLHQPSLLLLDEPSTGLDPRARRELTSHLRELCQSAGVTVLLTTHLIDEAEQCDRLAVLDGGQVVGCDTPAALKAEIGGDVVTIEAADPAALREQIASRFGVSTQLVEGRLRVERAAGHRFVPELVEAFGGQVLGIHYGKPTLADVFVHLTGHGLEEHR